MTVGIDAVGACSGGLRPPGSMLTLPDDALILIGPLSVPIEHSPPPQWQPTRLPYNRTSRGCQEL
jgi:hypothetical protein